MWNVFDDFSLRFKRFSGMFTMCYYVMVKCIAARDAAMLRILQANFFVTTPVICINVLQYHSFRGSLVSSRSSGTGGVA